MYLIRSFYTAHSDVWFAVRTGVVGVTCHCNDVTGPCASINIDGGLLWACYNIRRNVTIRQASYMKSRIIKTYEQYQEI